MRSRKGQVEPRGSDQRMLTMLNGHAGGRWEALCSGGRERRGKLAVY